MSSCFIFMCCFSLSASAAVGTFRGVGTPVVADESVSLIFQLSFLYYAVTGGSIVILVGLLVSYLTEAVDPKCQDPQLYSPLVRHLLPYQSPLTSKPPQSTEDYKMVSTNPDVQDEKKAVDDL